MRALLIIGGIDREECDREIARRGITYANGVIVRNSVWPDGSTGERV